MTTGKEQFGNPNLGAESELQMIRKIMEESKSVVCANGKPFIMWGVLVSAALIVNYVFTYTGTTDAILGMMWFVLMTGGAIASIVMERKENKKRRVKPFAGDLLGTLWLASGISMFIFGFVGTVTGAYDPLFICPVISTVLGLSFFVSGSLEPMKWFKYLAIGWWLVAVLLFIFPSRHTLLIFAIMMLLMQTLPGVILYRKWKNEELQAAPAEA